MFRKLVICLLQYMNNHQDQFRFFWFWSLVAAVCTPHQFLLKCICRNNPCFFIIPIILGPFFAVSRFIEEEGFEDLYSQKGFDRINKIGVLSIKTELGNSNFKVRNSLLYAPPGWKPLDYFEFSKKNTVSHVPFANFQLPIYNLESLYKPTSVQLKNNIKQKSTPKIKKQLEGKLTSLRKASVWTIKKF